MNLVALKIKKITKLPKQHHVYDLSVDETHNFFVGDGDGILTSNCDAISLDAQKALRGVMEEYAGNTRFIFTCNYIFKIIPALQSRCQIFSLTAPLDSVISRVIYVLKQEGVIVPESQKPKLLELIRSGYPDLRRILNDLQKFSFSGTLDIKENRAKGIASEVCKKLKTAGDAFAVRQYVIEREQDFSGNYLQLLKEMFEIYFKNETLGANAKSNILLGIADAIYKDSIVIDKEINWFAAVLKIAA